jgi:hypothetical protein
VAVLAVAAEVLPSRRVQVLVLVAVVVAITAGLRVAEMEELGHQTPSRTLLAQAVAERFLE